MHRGRRGRRRARARRHRDGLLRGRRGRVRRRARASPPATTRPSTPGRSWFCAGALPLSGETGIARGRAASPCDGTAPRRGRAGRHEPRPGPVGALRATAASASSTRTRIRGLRVVMDAANGMAGLFLPPVLERLAIDAGALLPRSGRAASRITSPTRCSPENRAFIEGPRCEQGADLGHRLGRRRRPVLLHRRPRRLRARRLPHRAAGRAPAAPPRPRADRLRPAGLLGRARHDPRRGRHAGRVPRGPRLHQARACGRSTRCSPAR